MMTMTLPRALVLLPLVACGGGADAQPDGALPPVADAAVPADAGPPIYFGEFHVAEDYRDYISSIWGWVGDETRRPTPVEVSGSCWHRPDPPDDPVGFDAGRVRISGLALGSVVEMGYGSTSNYNGSSEYPDLYEPGALIRFEASGATVAAFDGTVIAPAVVDTSGIPGALMRGTPGELTWEPTGADVIRFTVKPVDDVTQTLAGPIIDCEMVEADGRFPLDDVMALLTDAADAAVIHLEHGNRTVLHVPEAEIELWVTSEIEIYIPIYD